MKLERINLQKNWITLALNYIQLSLENLAHIILSIKKTKLYPVASWLKTQHVFYNAVDRAENALHDAFENGTEDEFDKACEWRDRITELCGKFDCMPIDENQVVYMEYNDYKLARSVIEGYVWRHNDVICHGQRPMEVTDIIDC